MCCAAKLLLRTIYGDTKHYHRRYEERPRRTSARELSIPGLILSESVPSALLKSRPRYCLLMFCDSSDGTTKKSPLHQTVVLNCSSCGGGALAAVCELILDTPAWRLSVTVLESYLVPHRSRLSSA